jgi:hypothetical protein
MKTIEQMKQAVLERELPLDYGSFIEWALTGKIQRVH